MKLADMTARFAGGSVSTRRWVPSRRSNWVTPLFGLVLLALLANVLTPYWVFLAISAVVSAVGLLGLGVVSGSAGMISLCQMSFAAVGAWVVAKLNEVNAPGGLICWIVIGGLAAAPFGILIGLPALRLRGVHLAVVTLGFATACDTIIQTIGFPGSSQYVPIARPGFVSSDKDYFVMSGCVFIVIAAALTILRGRRIGAAWRTVRFSERATAAAGYSVPRTKLSAFAIGAFVAGVSGGLLAGQVGLLAAQSFTVSQSLLLYVLAMMLGAQYVDGAIVGGAIGVVLTELLSRLNVNQNWLGLLFGVAVLQALASGRSASEEVRVRLAIRRERSSGAETAQRTIATPPSETRQDLKPATSSAPVLQVRGLSVSYGAVHALSGVDLEIPAGVVTGLIGPNGAGKSTLVDALTGFVPRARGEVSFAGLDLAGHSVRSRALAGLRRTFQQDRVPPSLTIGEYLRFASHGRASRDRISEVLRYFDAPKSERPISLVDVGTRRLLEIAGILLSDAKLVILDEPAAGLGANESQALGARLAAVPVRFGASLLLIEHDLDLVRAACSTVTVLNFGKVIASGAPSDALADRAVTAAYLGDPEVLA